MYRKSNFLLVLHLKKYTKKITQKLDTLEKLKNFSLTAQTAQKINFLFSNVAYRLTVYTSGDKVQNCSAAALRSAWFFNNKNHLFTI